MKIKDFRKTLLLFCSGVVFVIVTYLTIGPVVVFLVTFFEIKASYAKIRKNGIQWISIRKPTQRETMEILGVFVHFGAQFLSMPALDVLILFLLYYLNNYGRILILLFLIFGYYNHHSSYIRKEKGLNPIHGNCIVRNVRSYFPVELVKTVELKPDRNYLCVCFPHGIIGIAQALNLGFDNLKWLELFPKIRPLTATLDVNFCIPIIGGILRKNGFISTGREALLHYLNRSNDPKDEDNQDGFTSNVVGLVVGGASEASVSKPGHYELKLKNRKGFVKLAIMTGASIVPSFSFNEVDIYDQAIGKPGSLLYCFQYFSKKFLSIWPTIIIGRGFFQKSFGILPHRKRLVQVVGVPIEVQKCETPDPAYVDEIHQKVIDGVTTLFESNKEKYIENYEDVTFFIS